MKRLLGLLCALLFSVPAMAAGLPSGYTELEWIDNKGAIYIDTGIHADLTTVVDMRALFNSVENVRAMIGARNDTNTSDGNTFQFGVNSGKWFNRYGVDTPNEGTAVANTWYDVHIENHNVSISDGTNTKTYNYGFNSNMNTQNSLYLFATHDNGHSTFISSGKMSYCKIYKGGSLIADYVPARRESDGAIGLYDLADSNPSTAFKTGLNGTFTGGDPVNPCNNLFDKTKNTQDMFINSSGTAVEQSGGWIVSDYIPVSAGTYTWSFYNNKKDYYKRVAFFTSNTMNQGEVITAFDGRGLSGMQTVTVTVASDGYIRFGLGAADTFVQFERGNTRTAYCTPAGPIKIATTKYNNAAFSSVVTALSNAVDTIKTVVSNTINQATAVANLHSGKQTKPTDTCPNGKICLLVEDESGTPHWYEIIERAPGIVPAGSGYTQVEYLQMPAGSYINTAVVPQGDYRMEFDFATTSLPASNTSVFGERGQNAAGVGIQIGLGMSGQFTLDGLGQRYQPATLATANTRYKYVWDNKTVTLTSGSTTIGTNTFTGSEGTQTLTLVLNGLNNVGNVGGNAQIRSYSFKIWDANGSYVADFVPARRNSDGVLGMYDTVSGNFFTNAGSGEFTTPGYLPASFTPLPGLRSTGEQFINTGIIATEKTSIETQFINHAPDSSTKALVADRYSGGRYQFTIVAQTSAFSRMGSAAINQSDFWKTEQLFTVHMGPDGLKINDEAIRTWPASPGTFTSAEQLHVFGTTDINGRRAIATMYYLKIYQDGVLVQHLVPAQNSSGVLGMYDLLDTNISTAFHTNQGTGEFTAGPAVQ